METREVQRWLLEEFQNLVPIQLNNLMMLPENPHAQRNL